MLSCGLCFDCVLLCLCLGALAIKEDLSQAADLQRPIIKVKTFVGHVEPTQKSDRIDFLLDQQNQLDNKLSNLTDLVRNLTDLVRESLTDARRLGDFTQQSHRQWHTLVSDMYELLDSNTRKLLVSTFEVTQARNMISEFSQTLMDVKGSLLKLENAVKLETTSERDFRQEIRDGLDFFSKGVILGQLEIHDHMRRGFNDTVNAVDVSHSVQEIWRERDRWFFRCFFRNKSYGPNYVDECLVWPCYIGVKITDVTVQGFKVPSW